MFIDIHRHSAYKGEADTMIRNMFHFEAIPKDATNYYSLGIHPWHIQANKLDKDLELLRINSSIESIIAIGETGLDKTINVDFSIQNTVFQEHIAIANKLKKPMIIHCVGAYNELLIERKKNLKTLPWIIHWFNASKETGLDLIKKGCYLSFGNMLFKETSKAYKAFKEIPLENIFFETDDSTYSIIEIYEKAAELRNMPLLKLQEQMKTNFLNCFGIEV